MGTTDPDSQKKNRVNILFKNGYIIAIGIVPYAPLGFKTRYGEYESRDR